MLSKEKMYNTKLLDDVFNPQFVEKVKEKNLSTTELNSMTLEQLMNCCLLTLPEGWEESEQGIKTTVSLDNLSDLLTLEGYLEGCGISMYNNPAGGYVLELSVNSYSNANDINKVLESQSLSEDTKTKQEQPLSEDTKTKQEQPLSGDIKTKQEQTIASTQPLDEVKEQAKVDTDSNDSKDSSLEQETESKHPNTLLESLDRELENSEKSSNVKKFEGEQDIKTMSILPSFTESKVKCYEEDGLYFVKLPIAMEGEWLHPNYGELKFSKEDLERIKNNIDNNVLGWEPPVFYGHPTESGAGCEGYLIKTNLEELDGKPILFGYWRVNEIAYTQVKENRYRYSSSEFVENFQDLKDGKDLGTVLIGMALTNRPFMPDLPTNKALSIEENENNKLMFSFELGTRKKNPEQKEENKKGMEDVKELKQQLEGYQAELEKYSKQLDETKTELEGVKTAYQEQLNAANEQIKTLSENARNFELNRKLKRLEALNLPNETKERNKKLLESGSLGNSEEDVLLSLEEMSKSYSSTVLDQHGVVEETQNEHADTEKPSFYEDQIKRNLELAEKQRERRYERASSRGYRA